MIAPTLFAESPEAVGIDSSRLEALFARVRQEVDEGLLPAAQVAVAREGRIAGMATFGEAADDSLFHVFSATKAITSAAAWLLIQEGKLDEREVVSGIVPGFKSNGKENITVEQLFTHTAGFPHAPFRVTDWFDKERRYRRFEEWRLNWPAGSRFEYHPTSSMYVAAEIIEQRSGWAFEDFVRRRIALPLGLPDLYVGCPDEQHHRIKNLVHTGEPVTAADYEKAGLPVPPPQPELTEDSILNYNNAETRRVPVPGAGGIMSAAELALFYQGLLHGGPAGGERLWSKQTLEGALRVRTGDLADMTYNIQANRALGVIVAGDGKRNLRGFGHHNSASSFGHIGVGGQIAWADPETGISLGYCTHGMDRNPMRMSRRVISISNRAAVCRVGDTR